MEVNGTGNIITKDEFGDCQLHVEWATPKEVKGEGQDRDNRESRVLPQSAAGVAHVFQEISHERTPLSFDERKR